MSSELPLSTTTYTVLGVLSVHQIALVIDVTTITTLATEIILKWIDNFKGFWKNGWNILDLAIVIVVRKSACKSKSDKKNKMEESVWIDMQDPDVSNTML